MRRDKFSIQFATPAWSQIGAIGLDDFDELLETLEHYAGESSARLRRGEPVTIEVAVPITAGNVIAECTFDDAARTITVLSLAPCERLGGRRVS